MTGTVGILLVLAFLIIVALWKHDHDAAWAAMRDHERMFHPECKSKSPVIPKKQTSSPMAIPPSTGGEKPPTHPQKSERA